MHDPNVLIELRQGAIATYVAPELTLLVLAAVESFHVTGLCILKTRLCASEYLKQYLDKRRIGQENLFSTSYGRM